MESTSQMNNQELPMEKLKLPIMEHFYTLQGEGFYSGYAAYFIRLGGCDVGCTWCDVKESWDMSVHPRYEWPEIEKWMEGISPPIVVITGGEPTMHDLTELTEHIRLKKMRTHIETSGTNPLTGQWDWITFSPKRFKKPLEEYFNRSHELKVIISHRNDLRWAKELQSQINENALLYIQPEWDRRKEMESECVAFIKENPEWKLSLQTHKYLGID